MPIQKYIKGSRDFPLEVGAGNIPGYTIVDLQGFRDNVGSAAFETVWPINTNLVFDNTPREMTLSSDSAADIDVTGTGCRDALCFTINKIGINNWYYGFQTLKMNGQTPITLTLTDNIRCWFLLVRDVGSAQSNVGNLYVGTGTVTAGVPAVVEALVPAGLANGAVSGAHFLPTQFCFIKNFTFSVAGNKSATIQILSYGEDDVIRILYQFEATGVMNSIPFDYTAIPTFSSTDIQVRAKTDTGTVSVFYNMQIILIDGKSLFSPFAK